MTPHPFDMGGGHGTPDRGCKRPGCGLPDRDPIHQLNPGVPMKATWVRCGNCKKQYEVPVEQPWRYMAVQQHKFACPAGSPETVAAQHAQLVSEFEAQGRQSKKPERRWFEFWRWFR